MTAPYRTDQGLSETDRRLLAAFLDWRAGDLDRRLGQGLADQLRADVGDVAEVTAARVLLVLWDHTWTIRAGTQGPRDAWRALLHSLADAALDLTALDIDPLSQRGEPSP